MRADRLSPALYAAGFAFALCVAAEGCEHKRPPPDTRYVTPLRRLAPDAGVVAQKPDAGEPDCTAYVCAREFDGEMSCLSRDVPVECYTEERIAKKCAFYLKGRELRAYEECIDLRRMERDRLYWRENSSW